MEEEVKKLKLEIEVLRKRVSVLEKIERRRKIVKIIKISIVVIIIVSIAILLHQWYDKIKEIYDQFQNFMNSPFKSFF